MKRGAEKMIIIKVFSWKKMKSIVLSFLVLIILLMSIFIYQWCNMEEKAVFNMLKEEVTLIITPGDPSNLYINDEKLGEQKVNAKIPYIINVKANDTIHIKMDPLHAKDNQTSTEKILSFKEGKLLISEEQDFWDNISINQWPNQVYQLSIHLTTRAKIELSGQEVLLEEQVADLNNDNNLEKVQLIKQGKYYFLKLNEGNKIILKDYEEEQSQWFIKDINGDGKEEIIIKGEFGNSHQYIEIFQYQDQQLNRIFWAYGDDIALFSNGQILVGKRLFDTVDHYGKTIYQWVENKYKEVEKVTSWWKGRPQWPMEPQMTVKAFFQAYELGLIKEAQGYLLEEDQNPEGVESMIQEVEEGWNQISLPSYYFFERKDVENIVYLSFYYPTEIHPRYNKVKVYEFELEKQENEQGPWKIRKVEEIRNYSVE